MVNILVFYLQTEQKLMSVGCCSKFRVFVLVLQNTLGKVQVTDKFQLPKLVILLSVHCTQSHWILQVSGACMQSWISLSVELI